MMGIEDYPIFINQQSSDIKNDLKSLLAFLDSKYVLFLTDDSLVYRPVEFTEEDVDEIYTDEVLNLSLRLGLNTIHVDYNDKSKIEYPENYYKDDQFIKWDWTKQKGGHLSHPFNPDGTIFRRDLILDIVNTVGFNTVRAFESNIGDFIRRDVKRPYLAAPIRSNVVCIPVNMTNDAGHYLPNGTQYPHSLKELNDQYLIGKYIDVERMNFKVTSVLQEIEYEFTNSEEESIHNSSPSRFLSFLQLSKRAFYRCVGIKQSS